MIAKRIPTILSAKIEEEALEVMRIYIVANQLKNPGILLTNRPFRSLHLTLLQIHLLVVATMLYPVKYHLPTMASYS
jgi:magnesium chelatase family protein